MYCPRCGSQVAPNAPYCPTCGTPQSPGAPQNPPLGAPLMMVPKPTVRSEKANGTKWIGQGWDLVKSDIPTFAVHAILYAVVAGAVPFILQGPMILGIQYSLMRRMFVGRSEIGDVFKGFNFFVPAMVAGILYSLFSSIGFALCLIPGFFVVAALQFPFLLILDKGMDFWPAMEASMDAAKRDWGGYLVFVLLQMAVVFVGVLACFVGLLVALPIVHAATVAAYQDVFGFEQRTIDSAR